MDQIEEMAERLRTQDNLLTEHPLYVVYDNMTIFGVDFDHADRFVWVDDEYREADSETLEDIAQIEGYENEITIAGTDYRRIGVRKVTKYRAG